MEIGDYYRTKKGLISKVKTMNTPETRREKHMGYVKRNVHLINGRHTLDDIKTHSPNKLDLVEKGDYVNGYKVCHITGHYVSVESSEKFELCFEEQDIKSIVTKEQFASVEYVF